MESAEAGKAALSATAGTANRAKAQRLPVFTFIERMIFPLTCADTPPVGGGRSPSHAESPRTDGAGGFFALTCLGTARRVLQEVRAVTREAVVGFGVDADRRVGRPGCSSPANRAPSATAHPATRPASHGRAWLNAVVANCQVWLLTVVCTVHSMPTEDATAQRSAPAPSRSSSCQTSWPPYPSGASECGRVPWLMYGSSYVGATQWLAAVTAPPSAPWSCRPGATRH